MGRKVKRSTRKRSTRKQRGRGVVRKLISRGLRLAGKPGLANAADMLGYGRRKKKGTRKRVGLKGSLGAILRAAKPARRRRTSKKTTMRGRGVSMSAPIRGGVHTMRGRGFIGKTLGGVAGGLLGGLLPF